MGSYMEFLFLFVKLQNQLYGIVKKLKTAYLKCRTVTNAIYLGRL